MERPSNGALALWHLPVLSSLDEMAIGSAARSGDHGECARPDRRDPAGVSVNPLNVEAWGEDRPVRVWVARRLYDYSHLQDDKGPGIRPWILRGRLGGRRNGQRAADGECTSARLGGCRHHRRG
jgi:hypothetical protein